MESILTSIKKMLGITESCESFDPDIIIHINSVFVILNQMGIGTESIFSISDKTSTWDQFLNDDKTIDSVKTYMYMKVRSMFDPPTNSIVADSMKRLTDELEWRLNLSAETNKNN